MGKKKPIQINSVADKMKAEGQCRQCSCIEKSNGALKGRGVRELSRHRLVPGRDGGEYIVANVIPLCRNCHDEVEKQHPAARRRLRPKLWPMEVSHAIRRMGAEWFELMYPKPAAASVLMREVDALVGREPANKRRVDDLAVLMPISNSRKKKQKMWDPDTIPGPSEKSLARRRATSIVTTNKFA